MPHDARRAAFAQQPVGRAVRHATTPPSRRAPACRTRSRSRSARRARRRRRPFSPCARRSCRCARRSRASRSAPFQYGKATPSTVLGQHAAFAGALARGGGVAASSVRARHLCTLSFASLPPAEHEHEDAPAAAASAVPAPPSSRGQRGTSSRLRRARAAPCALGDERLHAPVKLLGRTHVDRGRRSIRSASVVLMSLGHCAPSPARLRRRSSSFPSAERRRPTRRAVAGSGAVGRLDELLATCDAPGTVAS